SSGSGVSYAESRDAKTWTAAASQVVIGSGTTYTRVYGPVGGTYYMYVLLNIAPAPISVYTASALAGPWTLQNTNGITVGSAGAWDSFTVYPSGVIDIISGTWYMS